MFISFPAIVFEGFGLDSLAFSLRNAAFRDKYISTIARPVAIGQPYFSQNSLGFAKSGG